MSFDIKYQMLWWFDFEELIVMSNSGFLSVLIRILLSQGTES